MSRIALRKRHTAAVTSYYSQALGAVLVGVWVCRECVGCVEG